MALGMDVGLGPSHIALDGEPAPLSEKGSETPPPNFTPIFTARTMLALQALY